MKTKLRSWAEDYLHAIYGHGHVFLFRKPPGHYLGNIKENKPPVILIPGILTKWNFLNWIVKPVSLKGHPIYVIDSLGFNTSHIYRSARLVRGFIEKKKLRNVILIAHSKGGLIGKHLLAFYNPDRRIKKLIAIATPFGGSKLAEYLPNKIFKELHPRSRSIRKLQDEMAVNKKIVSIFGVYDNHVWPTASCRLAGARNIQVPIVGHHKILFDDKVRKIVLKEAGST